MMLDEEEAGGALGWLGTSLASSTTSPCLTPGLVSTLKEKSGRRLSFSSGIPAKLFEAGSEMGTIRQEQIEGLSFVLRKAKASRRLRPNSCQIIRVFLLDIYKHFEKWWGKVKCEF